MKDFDQQQLVNRITAILDQSVEGLDSGIQLRLDEMRGQSLLRPRTELGSDEGLDPLIMATRVSLDDSAEALDPQINHRLDEIRKIALTQPRSHQHSKSLNESALFEKFRALIDRRRFAVPVGAFATACVLVTVVSLFYLRPNGSPLLDEDIILFASTDEIELYQNLEFYEWLAENGLSN